MGPCPSVSSGPFYIHPFPQQSSLVATTRTIATIIATATNTNKIPPTGFFAAVSRAQSHAFPVVGDNIEAAAAAAAAVVVVHVVALFA